MLVCNVSLRPPRRVIATEIAEVTTAVDATASGNIVFATLVDDPASVSDTVDAYLGAIMLEAASAADTLDGSSAVVPVGSTWSTSDKTASITLSGSDLVATTNGSFSTGGVRATKSISSGKAYFEITDTFSALASSYPGVATGAHSLTSSSSTDAAWIDTTNFCQIFVNGSSMGFLDSFGMAASGDVFCVALDLTNKRIWIRKNGNAWNASGGTADPATNTGGFDVSAIFTGVPAFPIVVSGNSGAVNLTLNAGGAAFAYTVPSGFVSWDSA